MRALVIGGFVLTALALFVFGSLLFGHLSPRFVVDAVPPEGLEDTYFRGWVEFHCPTISYSFTYRLPTSSALEHVHMRIEGRHVPLDLCRPDPTGSSVCRRRPHDTFRASGVFLPACERVRNSHPLVRIIPEASTGPVAIGTLVRHETE